MATMDHDGKTWHDQAEIDRIVKQRIEDFRQAKLKPVEDALSTARQDLATMTTKANQYDALHAEHSELKMSIERDNAFRAVGLGLDGLDDEARAAVEAKRARLETFYKADAAQHEGDEPLTLSSYLTETVPNDPILSQALPTVTETTTTTTTQTGVVINPANGAQQPTKKPEASVEATKAAIREARQAGDQAKVRELLKGQGIDLPPIRPLQQGA